MPVSLLLVSIAGFLILAGVIIATIGFFMTPRTILAQRRPSLLETITELLRKLFEIMFSDTSAREKKIQAWGVFLVLLGVGFLLAAGVATLIPDAGTTTPPTPTAT
ncbi:hypothetical protein GCM10009860_20790 [Microbacterium mitrae]|uniref:Uncharacterized protein n=1 Tax=Microbacterium mitrae TaxID=664640 RepID=A0A5C8HLQ8_9MICO|nr:hypothetical protein [Microbacterium mitrae]TXK04418.1 hypothetical protein FVP60_06870 [Microbacterium mitrae]